MGATKRPRRGANGAARLCLDITLRNFGPIKKAAISLRPLTIFVGANGTGKSYAAMLAHSLVSAGRRLGRPGRAPALPAGRARRPAPASLAALEDALAGLGAAEEAPCPPGLASGIVRSSMRRYRELLQGEIVRNFGSGLHDLARSGTGHFSLSLKACNGATIAYGKDGMACRPDQKFSILLKKSGGVGAPGFRLGGRGSILRCTVAAVPRARIRDLAPLVHAGLELAVLRRAVGRMPLRSDYFPAARSGILQAHGAIASDAARNSPHAGIGGAGILPIPGVIADFVSSMAAMRESRGAHYDAGMRIESGVLGGHVGLMRSGPGVMPEIVYDHSSRRMPAHSASSTVPELAPLTLHLKHCAADRGVLIIEEPEAHLHPDGQIALAGHLVGLVRAGVDIIIATHSAPLFEAISQYYRASLLSPAGRKSALGREDLYICEGEIAPHLFQTDGGGGCVAGRIAASAAEGVEQEEFIRADRLLNENNMRIAEHSN